MDESRACYTELRLKDRNKYHTITYIWNLENVTDEPICRAGIETQAQRRLVDAVGEGVDGIN